MPKVHTFRKAWEILFESLGLLPCEFSGPSVLTAVMATHCSKYLMAPKQGNLQLKREFALPNSGCVSNFPSQDKQTESPEKRMISSNSKLSIEIWSLVGRRSPRIRRICIEAGQMTSVDYRQHRREHKPSNFLLQSPLPSYPFPFVRNKKLNKTHRGLIGTRVCMCACVSGAKQKDEISQKPENKKNNTTHHNRRPSKVSKFEGST